MNPTLVYIFGGTGDLANKKLFPAFYALFRQNKLGKPFKIIVIGRKPQRTDQLRQKLFDNLLENARHVGDAPDVLRNFLQLVFYHDMNFDDVEGYEKLKGLTQSLEVDFDIKSEMVELRRIAYLATAPEYFKIISSALNQNNLLMNGREQDRIVIEKPFGKDLISAKAINDSLLEHFEEKQIYRMDHYLAKSMIQNVMVIRFANAMFEPTWNNQFIEKVEMTVTEKIGVEDRGSYYDVSGALRDMVQSHLLQMLALIAMEVPQTICYNALCLEKVAVMEALSVDSLEESLNFGQYTEGSGHIGYLEEKGVSNESVTETFVALKVNINTARWSGVPFILKTGKAVSEKRTEIVITYKDRLPHIKVANAQPNQLKIRIQPVEGTSLFFNLIEPNSDKRMIVREMDYCQSCILIEGSPEAYEVLIEDVLQGNHELYTRWDEVEAAWQFIDPIYRYMREHPEKMQRYSFGSSSEVIGKKRGVT